MLLGGSEVFFEGGLLPLYLSCLLIIYQNLFLKILQIAIVRRMITIFDALHIRACNATFLIAERMHDRENERFSSSRA